MKAKCLMMTDPEFTFLSQINKIFFSNAFQKLQYYMSAPSSFYYFSNSIKRQIRTIFPKVYYFITYQFRIMLRSNALTDTTKQFCAHIWETLYTMFTLLKTYNTLQCIKTLKSLAVSTCESICLILLNLMFPKFIWSQKKIIFQNYLVNIQCSEGQQFRQHWSTGLA